MAKGVLEWLWKFWSVARKVLFSGGSGVFMGESWGD